MVKPGDAAVNIVTTSESSGLYQNNIDLNLSMILRRSVTKQFRWTRSSYVTSRLQGCSYIQM